MFVDLAVVNIQAGDGGNGCNSFRHEKFIDRGGPDGGNGGKGGDVIVRADTNQDTLANFRYQKLLVAKDGAAGAKSHKTGRSGQDLIVNLPVGCQVYDGEKLLVDLTVENQTGVIAVGGQGGFGNAHFKSSVRRSPSFAEKGQPGQKLTVKLELKLIADIGLVGLPNAGKSTFLAANSNAKPQIADYPFTTLIPNLGIIQLDRNRQLLAADIPGLIEGASSGKGLGDEFLRHIQRTKVLIHLIDINQADCISAYQTIIKELKAYKVADLSKKPMILALNKIDGHNLKEVSLVRQKLAKATKQPIFTISALSGQGVKPLLDEAYKIIAKTKKKKAPKVLPQIKIIDDHAWQIQKNRSSYLITGQKIELFAVKTDFNNSQSVDRLRHILKRTGIEKQLLKMGLERGQIIKFAKIGKLKY